MGFIIELVDPVGFSCCGYPLRSYNDKSWFLLSGRNLAIAERENMDMLPLCNGCYASLNEVKHFLDTNEEARDYVNSKIAGEGLEYTGKTSIRHVLEVLHKDIGLEKIRETITNPLTGLTFATHCGCHAIRPSDVKYTDDPEDPKMLEEIISALGAETKYYPEKMDCCGASLVLSDYETAFKLTGTKLMSLKKRNFDGLVTNCPFCFKMFDSRQDAIGKLLNEDVEVPVFYITQLLGLALDVDAFEIGLGFNVSPVEEVVEATGGSLYE